jgi:four helix bundle protein
MRDFKTLTVWQKAHQLTLGVYKATSGFPKDEIYGLTSQLRRATVSISANIAEGCGKSTDADFARYIHIAIGSANEVDYYFLLSRDLTFISEELFSKLSSDVIEVRRMLISFVQKLKAQSS